MIDNRINTFLKVCETMNYTAAAKALNLTQPAVSQHIRYLESHYGAPLFAYDKKQLSLTPQGEILLRAAETLSGDETRLKEKISAYPQVAAISRTVSSVCCNNSYA